MIQDKKLKLRNKCWIKIHKKGVFTEFPDSETIGLFKSKFNNKNYKILELGCGSGNNQIFFRKFYSNVFGIDISHNAIQNAKKILHKNNIKNKKHLYVMDIDDVHRLNKKFDIIFDYRAISNLPLKNIKRIFLNIKKLMKLKSFFIFRLYSKKWKKNDDQKINVGKAKNISLATFNKKDIIKIIPKNFKILHFQEKINYDIIYNKIQYSEFYLIIQLVKL